MLTSKQRAYLRGEANTMETILIVGKGGINEEVITQANDALRKRELIKGRILETAPESARDTAEAIAAACSAEVVQVIGTRFVLYKANPKEPVYKLPRAPKTN